MAQAGRMALTLVLALVLLALLGVKFLQAQGLNADLRARVTDDQANFIAAERAERRAGVIKTLLAADL